MQTVRTSLITRSGLVAAATNVLRILLLAASVLCFFALWFFNPQAGRSLLVLIPLAALASFANARASLIPWSIYILGFLIFVDLRMISAELFFPARFDYVILMERTVFFGMIPSEVLQDAWYVLGRTSLLDRALITVHFSFFLVPHVAAVWLWTCHRTLFRRYVYALVATCWAGLVLAFVLPTAPPWLAAGTERIPHVYRVVQDVMMRATPETYTAGLRAVGDNDAAAMPSLHTALTVLVALAAARIGGWAGLAGWTYAGIMALALVYLGEHYVVDIVAGFALALLFWSLMDRLAPAHGGSSWRQLRFRSVRRIADRQRTPPTR
ncbi:MAG TPA: phosphatase PAP2 family protein [Longimicrobiales bacterium]|nr:phosphatase PAP2 family protein [Longimicrobiales bacterium]